MVKLANHGHSVIRMHQGYNRQTENTILSGEDFGISDPNNPNPPAASAQGINLFADAQVPSFFR